MKRFLPLILLACSSCAIGSATAAFSGVSGYAIHSSQAAGLTKEAEDSIVLKVMKEMGKK